MDAKEGKADCLPLLYGAVFLVDSGSCQDPPETFPWFLPPGYLICRLRLKLKHWKYMRQVRRKEKMMTASTKGVAAVLGRSMAKVRKKMKPEAFQRSPSRRFFRNAANCSTERSGLLPPPPGAPPPPPGQLVDRVEQDQLDHESDEKTTGEQVAPAHLDKVRLKGEGDKDQQGNQEPLDNAIDEGGTTEPLVIHVGILQ
jgi:hypothetical protein